MTDNTNSNDISVTEDLDTFSDEFFGKTKPEDKAAVEDGSDEDATDTSPSDADDTKTDDSNSEADPEDKKGDDGEPAEKPKKKTASERISEVIGQRNAAETKLTEALARIAALEAAAPKEENTAPPVVADKDAPDPKALNEDGTPKYPLEEYDTNFLRDNARYVFKKEMEAARQEAAELDAQTRVEESRSALQRNWEAKLAEAEATDEMQDIREVGADLAIELSKLPPELGEGLALSIMEMENGPEVFYYLASNLDETRGLVAKGGVYAIMALGAIQERVRSGKPKEDGNPVKTKVSQAPEPPKIVNRGHNGRFETPDDTEDLDAFSAKFFSKK